MHGHVCVLKKRPDTSRGGVLTWSLPKKEICFCNYAVAPAMFVTCSEKEATYIENEMWFFDDPQKLNKLLHHWNDTLLDLTEYCGKMHVLCLPFFNVCPSIRYTDVCVFTLLLLYRRQSFVLDLLFSFLLVLIKFLGFVLSFISSSFFLFRIGKA